jgi:hypothetical protein
MNLLRVPSICLQFQRRPYSFHTRRIPTASLLSRTHAGPHKWELLKEMNDGQYSLSVSDQKI